MCLAPIPSMLPMTMNLPITLSNTLQIPGIFATSTPMIDTQSKPRRGRRSSIPPEQREQTRRLKKQNMERRRRACISDKMNALYNLAMNIVGGHPQAANKVEKADILNTCYKILQSVSQLASEQTELQQRLHQIRTQLPEAISTNTIPTDETTQSSSVWSDDYAPTGDSNLPDTLVTTPTRATLDGLSLEWDKENQPAPLTHMHSTNIRYHGDSRLSCGITDSGVYSTCSSIDAPLEHRVPLHPVQPIATNNNVPIPLTPQTGVVSWKPSKTSAFTSVKRTNVWRPYL